jgi:protein-tyrosine phosphatase
MSGNYGTSRPKVIPESLLWDCLALEDEAGEWGLPLLWRAARLIESHWRAGRTVLVHCEAGRSRSVSAAAAALILASIPHDISANARTLDGRLSASAAERQPETALEHIRAKRPEAAPNTGYLAQLATLAILLKHIFPVCYAATALDLILEFIPSTIAPIQQS